MKKFTGNFLNGGSRSALRMLRAVALGLVALLWANTAVLAQTCEPPTGTVYFYADNLDACYNGTNLYKVTVSLKDFHNVDSLNLLLDYDEVYWKFESAKVLLSEFKQTNTGPNGTNKPMTISDNASVLNFKWTEKVTRGNIASSIGNKVAFAELTFSLKNFPNNTLPTYINNLSWLTGSKVLYCGGGVTYNVWTNVTYSNGKITTSVKYAAPTVTISPAVLDCAGDKATVTVTAPVGAGYQYSYNLGLTWSTNPIALADAGDHVVWAKDAAGCLSAIKAFTVTTKAPLTFKTTHVDESCANLGEITVNVTSGGTAPLKYWCVPKADYDLGMPFDPKYSSTITNQFLVGAGTYYSNVEDKCGIANAWIMDSIAPGAKFTYDFDVTNETVTCYNGTDGEVEITGLTGGYPWIDGYRVFIAGVIDTMFAGGDLTISDIPVGTYEVIIADSVCSSVEKVTIKNTTPITFYVDYTDAPCTEGTGTIWITKINGKLLAETTVDYSSWTYQVVGNGIDTILPVGDTLEGLYSSVYSAWLIPGCPGKVPFVNVDGSGNSIPLLDDGAIKFKTKLTNETCFEECDGTIRVTDVTRTCENCNEGAVYEFRVTSTTGENSAGSWMAILDTAFVCPDTFLVEVRDASKPDVCIVSQTVVITGAESELTAEVSEIQPPTCKGGNDGWVKMYVTGGTAPYKYSVDNAPNWRDAPTFGLTEGVHLLRVLDAQGCEWDSTITVKTLDPNIMMATEVDSIECYGDKANIQVVISSYTNYADAGDYTWYWSKTSGSDPWSGTKFAIDEDGVTTVGLTAGTYYIGGKDPNGCLTNKDTVVIKDVLPLIVYEPVVEDAECSGTWSGTIILTVSGGNPQPVYEYAMANNPDVFSNPNAVINWVPFTEGDTVETIEVQKGTYYIKVRDYCDQTHVPVKAVVDGFDPIKVTKVDVTNVICNGDKNGGLVITAAGGAPGFGVVGSKYLYTVKDAAGKVVGTNQQTSNTYTKLPAGNYMVYVYDTTDPKAIPAQCPPDSMKATILEPEELMFDTEITHVSCAGKENGIIYVSIMGGVGGNYDYKGYDPKVASKDGKSYEVTINQIKGAYGYSLKLADGVDTVNFQTMGGDFEIVVKDAQGCMAIDTVTVYEPKPWVITPITKDPSDCNIKDGEIWAVVTGGFGADVMEACMYEPDMKVKSGMAMAMPTISVYLDGELSADDVISGDTILLSDTAVYGVEYVITAVNNDLCIDLTAKQCVGEAKVTIDVFNPFKFDVAVQCVQCYGGENGKVTVSNITGGSGKYQIQLVGGDNAAYDPSNNAKWWPVDAKGKPMYVNTAISIDTLMKGDYWIYLRDDSGFTLANCCRPIKFVMCQPDSLELISVTLVSNVECAGDSTGAFSIQATGGEMPYTYAFSYTEKTTGGFPYPGIPDKSEFVYTDSIISGLPSGTYVGWVMDANGCITGCEINKQGLPIDEHRVVIQQAAAVTVESYTVKEPLCYGGLADVTLKNVTGGGGDSVTFLLYGKTYLGVDTTYMFGPWAVGLPTYVLEDVYGSDVDGYIISVATDSDCKGGGDTIHVTQPPFFGTTATIISGAVCEGDDEVLVSITTQGGTAPFKYDIYQDGVRVRENSTIVNHVLNVGHEYVVVAKDAKGCDARDTLMIETPQKIVFDVLNISCFGEAKGSARISATGTPNREFKVWYREFEGDIAKTQDFQTYNGWFTESIDVLELFVYDDTNVKDVHYEMYIQDKEGCVSEIDTITFDKVQNPIGLFVETTGTYECTEVVKLTPTGGITPYVVTLNDEVVANLDSVVLSEGDNVFKVTDAHLRCEYSITKTYMPVVMEEDTMVYTYYGEEVEFVNDAAGVDSMLVEGSYSFPYVAESGCTRILNVDVVGMAHTYTIAEVQGTGSTTPLEGEVGLITGTVTAIVADKGMFVQDANAAWSGIWVKYADVSALGATVGSGVSVEGTIGEEDSVTTVMATSVELVAAPVVITPMEVAPTAAQAEMYESVLVKVLGGRATAAIEGVWTVYYEPSDDITVGKWLYAYTPVADHYYDVTGILDGRMDAFKLDPRMASDIVDKTVTKVDPEMANAFKVYPNPFNDHIVIANNDKLTRVVISNIAGQRVIDIEYPNSEIQTANLVSGVYVISLFTETGIVKTERIIKR